MPRYSHDDHASVVEAATDVIRSVDAPQKFHSRRYIAIVKHSGSNVEQYELYMASVNMS